MKIRLVAQSVAASFVLLAAAPGWAGTVCEKGRIKILQLTNNASEFVVQGDDTSTSQLNKRNLGGTNYGTVVREDDSMERWNEKYALIKMAYATRSTIHIQSSDGDCAGPMDEFTINVCPTDAECK